MELNFDWLNLHVGALVGTALVFGGMSFFAFVFTPMVFKFVEREDAAHFLRQVFPVYHRVIASLCCVPAVLLIPGRYTPEVTALLAVALLNVVSARFIVPAADAAREAGDEKRFAAIHRLSVFLHMGELIAILVVLIRLAQ